MAHEVRGRAEGAREEEIGRAGPKVAAVASAHEATKTSRKVATACSEEAEPTLRSAAESRTECLDHHRREPQESQGASAAEPCLITQGGQVAGATEV